MHNFYFITLEINAIKYTYLFRLNIIYRGTSFIPLCLYNCISSSNHYGLHPFDIKSEQHKITVDYIFLN